MEKRYVKIKIKTIFNKSENKNKDDLQFLDLYFLFSSSHVNVITFSLKSMRQKLWLNPRGEILSYGQEMDAGSPSFFL